MHRRPTPCLWREAAGALFALGLIALAIYVAGVLKAGEWSNLPNALGGSGGYFEQARHWASGAGPLPNSRPPVYTLLIGLCYRFAGAERALDWLAAIQSVLAFAVLLAGYALVRWRAGSVGAGCAAVMLAGLNVSMLREFLTGRETVVFAAMVLAGSGLFSMPSRIGWGRVFLLGVLGALAWLTRPTGVVLALVSGALLMAAEGKAPRRRMLVLAGAFAAGLSLPLGGWLSYQAATGQSLSLSGTSTFRNLYLGNNEAFAAAYPLLDIETIEAVVADDASSWREEGKSPDAERLRATLGFLASQPLEGARLAVLKALAFLTPRHFPRGSGRLVRTGEGWRIEDYEPAPTLHDLLSVAGLPGVLLLGLAFWKWRAMPPEVRYTTGVVTLALVLHMLSFAESRFRQAFDPALACSGVLALAAVVRSRRGAAGNSEEAEGEPQ